MAHVLTITMNPAVDISTSVERIRPTHKLRCAPARRDPGGGGINVARVADRLGSDAAAIYPAGGGCGQTLHRLVEQEHVRSIAIPIAEDTREDFTVVETTTGHEYRFISNGPQLSEAEWRACQDAVAAFRDPFDFLVASGSLPLGAPEDFYARIAAIARSRSAPFALDASGPALRAALDHGVDLAKPSLGELRELTGEPLASPASCVAACKSLVSAGKAKIVALTLGSQGAILATPEGAWRAWPLPIEAVSTVGAGDSFLAAMVCALASGLSPLDAFRHGVAAGSAALLLPGTQLCRAEDVRALFEHVAVDRAA